MNSPSFQNQQEPGTYQSGDVTPSS